MEELIVSHSPHIFHEDTTSGIMADVIISLLPATVGGCLLFGWKAVWVILVSVLSSVIFEYLSCKIMKRKNSIKDLSAVVTGLLLALNLPPEIPLFIVVIGSFVAIIVVKQMFGGIGSNFANPAITARIVLLVSFPTAMSTWTMPNNVNEKIITSATDTVSTATPLMSNAITQGTYSYKELLLGQIPGCIGETFKLLLILGGLYLILRKVITPYIPISIIGTVALLSWIFKEDPVYMILSGGLIIGAFFMATDYVTSPTNWKGHIIFGIGIGFITFIIRHFGNLPEGVSYAILLMNLFVPYIDKITVQKPFGWEAKRCE